MYKSAAYKRDAWIFARKEVLEGFSVVTCPSEHHMRDIVKKCRYLAVAY